MTATDANGGVGAACDKDPQPDRMIASKDRMIEALREIRAMRRETRAIMLVIADNLGVTIEQPDPSVHSG